MCPLLRYRRPGWWRVAGASVCYKCAKLQDRVILFMISLFQSAITCLQWPAEHIIVFGLAEGKVKEEEKQRRGGGWG